MAIVVVGGPWWAFVVRGVIAIVFGLLTFVLPGMALLTLVVLFGVHALLDGAAAIVAGFGKTSAREHRSWTLVLLGAVSVAAGVVAFLVPGLTAISLLYVVAGWAIVRGVLEVVAAVSLRKVLDREWLYVLGGVLSVVFGLLIAAFPGAGALALLFWIGAYAIVFGAMLVAFGLKLRRRGQAHATGPGFRDLAHGSAR